MDILFGKRLKNPMQLPEGTLTYQIIEILENNNIDTVDKLLTLWSSPKGKDKIQLMPGIGATRYNLIKKFVKSINSPIFDTRKKK